jgi:hypothetical protein
MVGRAKKNDSDNKICCLGIYGEQLVAVPSGFGWVTAVDGNWGHQQTVDFLYYMSPSTVDSSGMRPWKATFDPDYISHNRQYVQHYPLSDDGVPHPDTKIDYISWDGQWARAEIEYSGGIVVAGNSIFKPVYPKRPLVGNPLCQGAVPQADIQKRMNDASIMVPLGVAAIGLVAFFVIRATERKVR